MIGVPIRPKIINSGVNDLHPLGRLFPQVALEFIGVEGGTKEARLILYFFERRARRQLENAITRCIVYSIAQHCRPPWLLFLIGRAYAVPPIIGSPPVRDVIFV